MEGASDNQIIPILSRNRVSSVNFQSIEDNLVFEALGGKGKGYLHHHVSTHSQHGNFMNDKIFRDLNSLIPN